MMELQKMSDEQRRNIVKLTVSLRNAMLEWGYEGVFDNVDAEFIKILDMYDPDGTIEKNFI